MPYHTLPRARLGLIAVIALAAVMPPLSRSAVAQARIDTSIVRLTRIPVAPFAYRDDANTLLGHYVDVAQYFPDVAVKFECGELSLLTPDGDTLGIPWDHPLQHQLQTPRLPVYAYNSRAWANELVSLPFTPREGDTLSLFRMLDLRFPVRDADGNAREGMDTSALSVPDTVSFRIEVLDGGTRSVLAVLETVTLYPARGWSDCIRQLLGRMIDGSLPSAPLRSWTLPPSLAGERLRIRVVPVFHPQLRGEYSNRALYAFFFWSSRRAAYYAAEQRGYAAAFGAIIDSLRASRKRSAAGELSPPARCTVYPTQLTPESDGISIHLSRAAGGPGTLRLYDVRGMHVLSQSLEIPADRTDWTVPLNRSSLASGVYLLVLDIGGMPLVQPITIMR